MVYSVRIVTSEAKQTNDKKRDGRRDIDQWGIWEAANWQNQSHLYQDINAANKVLSKHISAFLLMNKHTCRMETDGADNMNEV